MPSVILLPPPLAWCFGLPPYLPFRALQDVIWYESLETIRQEYLDLLAWVNWHLYPPWKQFFTRRHIPITMTGLESEDILISPLLCIGGQSTRMGARKELLPFPDGRLAFEHAIDTIHDVFPKADTIFISLHDEDQLEGVRFQLEAKSPFLPHGNHLDMDSHQHEATPLKLEPLFDVLEHGEIGPAAGLLAAHTAHPNTTFLVLGCDYPLLPPTALQQLILEYEPPITCFLNAKGITEPLIAIWSPQALEVLKSNMEQGMSGLNRVVKTMKREDGRDVKLVRPLRDEWVTGCNTREEWEEALRIIKQAGI